MTFWLCSKTPLQYSAGRVVVINSWIELAFPGGITASFNRYVRRQSIKGNVLLIETLREHRIVHLIERFTTMDDCECR
jgi:hypothetical protein